MERIRLTIQALSMKRLPSWIFLKYRLISRSFPCFCGLVLEQMFCKKAYVKKYSHLNQVLFLYLASDVYLILNRSKRNINFNFYLLNPHLIFDIKDISREISAKEIAKWIKNIFKPLMNRSLNFK